MSVPSEGELGDYIKTLRNTAAGPSNFSYAMVKFLWAPVPKPKPKDGKGDEAGGPAPEGPSPADESAEEATEEEPVHWGRKLLLSLVAEAIRLRDLPDAVCQGNILGITKSREWDGDIENNLRPITLQEVALKLTTGLLNARLSRTIHQNGLLKGANYGFRPGVQEALYILLQDIRRAYDSVSWESMELSMRRLNVPEGYIELHRNIFRRRRARAISGHGLSDEFELECGLPQGGVESPLHWLIFYDALLCAQERLDQHERQHGKKTAKTIEHYAHPESWEEPGTAYVMGNPRETDAAEREGRARVSGVAYADDTKWMSGSMRGLQAQADVAGEFFRLHDIEVNAKKTIFTWNNARREVESKPGAHPAAKKKEKQPSPPKINVALIERKKLTANEACYLVEAVVQARISYGLKLMTLSESQCQELDRIWMRVVKHHGNLAASTTNYAIWSHGEAQIRLCAPEGSLLARGVRHRVRALQEKLGVPLLPTEFLNAPISSELARGNSLAAIMPQMQRRKYRLMSNHARYAAFRTLPGAEPWPDPERLDRRYVPHLARGGALA
eukprot:tig00000396_g24886.t1